MSQAQELFGGRQLRDYLDERRNRVLQEIARTADEALWSDTAEYVARAQVQPITIDVANATRRPVEEIEVDATQLPDAFQRGLDHRDSPVHIKGLRVTLLIPFTGDAELLRRRPNLYGPPLPRARAQSDRVEVTVEGPADSMNAEQINSRIRREIEVLERWIQAANKEAEVHNSTITSDVDVAIDKRRVELSELQHLESDLDFPVEDGGTGQSRGW